MTKNERGSAVSWLVVAIIFLAFVVLGLFGYSAYKENARKKAVEKEIAALEEQAENIKKENMALKDRISYLGSKDYQEIQAKDKLNLQNPGENVVVITSPRISPEKDSVYGKQNEDKALISDEPNFKKWWNYFFKPQVF